MIYMYFIILCSVVVSNCCYIVILNNVKNIFDSFFEILSLLILFVSHSITFSLGKHLF